MFVSIAGKQSETGNPENVCKSVWETPELVSIHANLMLCYVNL